MQVFTVPHAFSTSLNKTSSETHMSLFTTQLTSFSAPHFLKMLLDVHLQGCALRKIKWNPVLSTCEIQSTKQRKSMKTLKIPSRPRAKVSH